MKEVVEVLKARGVHDKLAQEFWKDYKKHLHLKDRTTSPDGKVFYLSARTICPSIGLFVYHVDSICHFIEI